MKRLLEMLGLALDRLRAVVTHYRHLPHLTLTVYIGLSIALLIVLPNLPNHETDWEKTYASSALDWYHGVHEPWKQHTNFVNPPFVLPLILPLALLGLHTSLVVYMAIMLVGLYFAARQLGGSPLWLVVSYPGIWMLAYGQFELLVCVGIALGWYAVRTQKYGLLNLAYLLMLIKPQIGIAPSLLFALWTPSWRLRLHSSWLPVIAIGWTFVNWGLWPLAFAQRLAQVDQGLAASIGISLWPTIGPLALVMFVPAATLPANRGTRLLLMLAANALASPYYPAYSLLPFLAFPLPWWAYVAASLPALDPDASIFSRGAMLLPLAMFLYYHRVQPAD